MIMALISFLKETRIGGDGEREEEDDDKEKEEEEQEEENEKRRGRRRQHRNKHHIMMIPLIKLFPCLSFSNNTTFHVSSLLF